MPILEGLAELRYNLYSSECFHKITKKSFSESSELICSSCDVVGLHYGTYGTIPDGKNYFLSSIFDPELHN